MELFTALTVGLMFAVGIFQMLRRNLIRSIIGLVILGNAINLFLLSAGAYNGLVPPYTTEVALRSDALPQAFILTAIVISMGGVSFALAMLYVISARYRTSDMDEVRGLHR